MPVGRGDRLSTHPELSAVGAHGLGEGCSWRVMYMLTSVDDSDDAIDERHFHDHKPVAGHRYRDWKSLMCRSPRRALRAGALAGSVLGGYSSSNPNSAH